MPQATPEELQSFGDQRALARQCDNHYLAPLRQQQKGGAVSTFDSVHADPAQRPTALNEIVSLSVFDGLPPEDKNILIAGMDEAVTIGVNEYQRRNGGNLPDASVIAMAFQTAHNTLAVGTYDSITSLQQQQTSFVPDIPKITIANIIASASPVIAYIPNVNKSTKVPLIYLRTVANKTFGALNSGDYLDGVKSGQGYFEGRFKFKLVADDADKTTFKQVLHTCYSEAGEAGMLPDTKSQVLPTLAENSTIRLNGIEIADTRNVPNQKSYSKPVKFNANQDIDGVIIDNETYTFASGSINPMTGEVEVKLNKELPADAVLTVHVITDFSATKNNNQEDFVLGLVGASLEDTIQYLQLVTGRCGFTLAPEVVEQYANELNIAILSVPLNAIQCVFYLEQHIRLLKEGRDLAKGTKKIYRVDLQRGVTGNLAGAFNSTADLVREIFKQVDLAKVKMKKQTGVSSQFVLYVGDVMAVMFKQMNSSDFTKTNEYARNGEIVKIGTMSDGTEVYHTPTEQGVVLESEGVSDMLLVGKSNDPLQNP